MPVLGSSVHISFTPSSTMLQCLKAVGIDTRLRRALKEELAYLSKAFTLPRSFLLFLKRIRIIAAVVELGKSLSNQALDKWYLVFTCS